MQASSATDFLTSSAALCAAVLNLRGDQLTAELGRIARALLASPHGSFLAQGQADGGAGHQLACEVASGGTRFGRFVVGGRAAYDEQDARLLAGLAGLAASLLQVNDFALRSTQAYLDLEAELSHQAQILDQIHESVLTMDQTGYITRDRKSVV